MNWIRYRHIPPKPKTPATGMVAQTLPMATMFLRNKMLSWVCVSVCLQHYLNFRNTTLSDDASSPLLNLVMSIVGLITAYLDILYPNFGGPAGKIASQSAASATASTTA